MSQSKGSNEIDGRHDRLKKYFLTSRNPILWRFDKRWMAEVEKSTSKNLWYFFARFNQRLKVRKEQQGSLLIQKLNMFNIELGFLIPFYTFWAWLNSIYENTCKKNIPCYFQHSNQHSKHSFKNLVFAYFFDRGQSKSRSLKINCTFIF